MTLDLHCLAAIAAPYESVLGDSHIHEGESAVWTGDGGYADRHSGCLHFYSWISDSVFQGETDQALGRLAEAWDPR